MALIEPPVPSAVWWAFLSQAGQFLRPGDPPLSEFKSANAFAQQVFSIRLNKLLERPDLGEAVPAGWRFLTETSGGKALSAEVQTISNTAPRMTGLSRGRRVNVAIDAAVQLRRFPAARETDYSVRVLALPSLLIEAFWLRDLAKADRSTDILIPFYSVPGDVERLRSYAPDDLLKGLRPLALGQKEFDDKTLRTHPKLALGGRFKRDQREAR